MTRYPVAIEIGNDQQAYGVVVPDLPGVFSAGDSLEEALEQTKDAILLALEDYAESGEAFPAPSSLHELMMGSHGKGGPRQFPRSRWVWYVVDIDTSKLNAKAVRVNITLPEPLLKAIDKFAEAHGETRSGFIALASQHRLGN